MYREADAERNSGRAKVGVSIYGKNLRYGWDSGSLTQTVKKMKGYRILLNYETIPKNFMNSLFFNC